MEEKNLEINLLDIFQLLKEKIVWLLCVALLCGVCGFIFSSFMIAPKYEASIDMVVNNKNEGQQVGGQIGSDSFNAAKQLISSYSVIIRSNTVLNQVIADLGLDMKYGELKKCVSVGAVDNTTVMKVLVNTKDVELSKKIVAKIAEIAPPFVVDTMEAGSCKIASDVYYSDEPVSPNVKQITMIAFLLGAVACAGVVIVADLFDNTFRTEQDIRNEIDIPVLGILPSVESCIAGAAAAAAERKGKKV